MISVAVVEDSAEFVAVITAYCKKLQSECGEEISVKAYKNAIIFLEDYKMQYDIVLMDICMPHMDGMEAARRLREKDSEVIIMFVTNMAQFAVNGYEVEALDFIVKPINYTAFKIKMQRAIKKLGMRTGENVMVPTRSGKVKVAVSDIKYIEVSGHTLIFHMDSGEKYEGRGSLTAYENQLNKYGFSRCNGYCLLNLKHINKVAGDYIIFNDGLSIEISRAKKKKFLERLSLFIANGE